MQESENLDRIMVVAGLPEGETGFTYLTGCWKRERGVRSLSGRKVSTDFRRVRWLGSEAVRLRVKTDQVGGGGRVRMELNWLVGEWKC